MEDQNLKSVINSNKLDEIEPMENINISKEQKKSDNIREKLSNHFLKIKMAKAQLNPPKINPEISQNVKKSKINVDNNLNIKKTFKQNYHEEKQNNKEYKNYPNEKEIIEEKKEIDNYIKTIFDEFLGRNSLIKKTNSMPDLTHINIVEAKVKKRPSLMRNKQSNINELNNLNEVIGFVSEKIIEEQNESEDFMPIIKINDNIYDKQDNNSSKNSEDEKEDDDEQNEQPIANLRSRSFYKEKEMTYLYYEENEHKNSNIKYNNTNNQIDNISSNLLLKKIIFEDFLKKQPDIILHFCQQCFCFIKTDVFFEKILNCYLYYRKKKISIEKLANLIDFLNALIIEMIEYYKSIPLEDLPTIKNIYNTIISDLIVNHYFDDEETIEDKNELINKNLAINTNDEAFKKIVKNEIKYDEKIEKEESIFFDKDYIVIEKEKDKDTFDENIYNEEKELNEFIYKTFLEDNYESSKNNLNQNFDNFSIISKTENLLMILYPFLYLLKSKRPTHDRIINAKNTINLYKYLKKEEPQKKEEETVNKLIKKNALSNSTNPFLNKSNSLNMNINKSINHRKYMLKGFFSILDWKIEEIGDVLINVTKKLLQKIEKKELYKAIYLKKDKELKSPNVIENINNFNKLTFFIIEDIISYDHASDRAKIIDKWIQVAEYCKAQRDYNDCIAINSALNSYIITGLTLTNKELKYKTNNLIKSIGKFCSCNGNYKYIREEIQILDNNKEYFYPYLGMMLRDITFLEESSKYLVDGENFNFNKIESVNNIMESNFRFKNQDIKEDKNQIIQELNFFEDLEMNTEENLESIADKIEPKFLFNDGKKDFKRTTKIDEKFFSKYKNPMYLRKSSTVINLFSHG